MAAIFSAFKPFLAMASAATPVWVDQISIGSCYTQPGFGNI